MNTKTTLASLAVATVLATGAMTPLSATPAEAGGLYEDNAAKLHYVHRRGRRHAHPHRWNRRGVRRHHRRHSRRHRGYAAPYYYKRKKNRTGKYIALGVGALMLGIIASQAARSHHRSYDYYDY